MIRLGMMGTGNISRDALTPAIAEVDDAVLWSVFSRERDRADAFAAVNGAAAATAGHDDLQSFLADPELDAVIIATPDRLHAEQAIAAARAGKHVLVEKPMATSVDEADAMVAACRAAGVQLGVAYHMRWHLDSFELQPGQVFAGFCGFRWFPLVSNTSEALFSMPRHFLAEARRHDRELHQAAERPPRATGWTLGSRDLKSRLFA